MGKKHYVITGLLCLTVFFVLNYSVTMYEVRRGKGRYTIATTQKPSEKVKIDNLVKSPVTAAPKPIEEVTVDVKIDNLVKSPVTAAPKPIEEVTVDVKIDNLVKSPVTAAPKPIEEVTVKQEAPVTSSVEFPINKATFDINRRSHKVWSNKAMSQYILGKRYEEFMKKSTTDGLVQEVQPRKFEFIINNETLCRSSERLEFLAPVYTAPKHFEDRDAIRKTWGRQNLLDGHTSRTVFMLGAVVDPKLQEKILNESKIYGDIVQANYIDSYHNLSFKGISLLQWVKEYCSNAQYMVKADDDLYVDVFQVVKAIQVLLHVPRFIIGEPFPHSGIIRQGYPKWNVKRHLFPADTYYPFYYQGWIYILPNAVYSDFYNAAMTTPVFHIDDVYMTGLLAGQLSNMDFLTFRGKAPKDTFMPAHNKFAIECGPPCKVILFCEHLTRLTSDDRKLIAKDKLEIATGELECERLLREKMEKEMKEKKAKEKAEEERKAKEKRAEEEMKAKEKKAEEEKKANNMKAEEEKRAREKTEEEKKGKEKEAAITLPATTEAVTFPTSLNTAQTNGQ